MSFWSDIAPIAGTVAGSAAFGPVGGAVGGMIGGAYSDDQRRKEQAEMDARNWERNVALQKEFAQHGIRWKVEDAKAAGIHPLVGLGAQTHSASPISVGSISEPSMMASMGQDLTRAITSTQNQQDRQLTQLSIQGAQLDVEGKAIDNQIKKSQLTKMQATGPAFPSASGNFISGQGNSGRAVVEKPLERTASLPGSPQAEPGAIPDVGWAKTATGIVPVPSTDVKQRIEDNMPHEWAHFYRNNIMPDTKPPKSALPKGSNDWKWNQMRMEWQPFYPSGKPRARDRAQEVRRYYKEGA